MNENKSLLSRIVTWTIIGILAVLAFKLATWLLGFLLGVAGMVVGIALFLLFTVGPILLVGWLAVKAWNAFTKEPVV